MRDPIIRHAFHSSVLLSAHADNNSFVVDELVLKNGLVRADIAVLNGCLIGYEIKGEKDTLLRLPLQVAVYSEVFNKAYLIISEKHLSKAIEQIPDWWGIYLVKESKSLLAKFKRVRTAKFNKYQNPYTILQLLWKAEALEFANSLLPTELNPRTTKRRICEVICQNCSVNMVSQTVTKYLKQRKNWRIDQ